MISTNFFSRKKWNRREIIFFLERLEMYISAGLVLDQALEAILEGVNKKRRSTIVAIRDSIEQGGSISVALHTHIKIPNTIKSLIRHGELSGQLQESLSTARVLIEREDRLIKNSLSSMTYPLVIGIFAGLLTIGLLRGVMPQIIPMLRGLNVELPIITLAVIAISEGLLSYGLYLIIFISLSLFITNKSYKRSLRFKKVLHIILINVPIVGQMTVAYHLSVFLRSAGALIENGFPINTSYLAVTESISFLPLHSVFASRISEINRGVSFGNILKHNYIPEYVAPMVMAGERSGSLGHSLIRVADVIDRDIEQFLKRITALIEPVMMIAMGCVVGAIALSIMIPIYDISRVLQK